MNAESEERQYQKMLDILVREFKAKNVLAAVLTTSHPISHAGMTLSMENLIGLVNTAVTSHRQNTEPQEDEQ